jgi:thioredoxin
MKNSLNRKYVYGITLFTLLILSAGCSEAKDIVDTSLQSEKGSEQVIFVELGSSRCIPCKMMQPVMESIEKAYAGKVKVIFYDVWTEEGKPYAQEYGIQAIPTQVFLDSEGNEFYRHTGFLAENLIVDILEKQGVKK